MTKTKTYPTILDSITLLGIMLILFGLSSALVSFVGSYYSICLDYNPYADIFMCIVSEGFVIFYGCKKSNISYIDLSIFKKISPLILIPIAISTIGIDIILSECDNILTICFHGNINLDTNLQSICDEKIMLIGSIISPVIVAPILEEILFRGIILKGYLKNYSKYTAIIVSSLFFALMHRHIGQAFGAFILGIFCAWIYIETKSLLSSIFAHFIANSSQYILTYILNIKIKGYNLNSNLVEYQPLYFDILGITLTIVGITVLIKIFTKGYEGLLNN